MLPIMLGPIEYGVFTKRAYLAIVTMGLTIAILCVALVVAVGAALTKDPILIAQTPDGRTIPVVPLKEPMVTAGRASAFVTEAILTAFTFDYVNFRAQLTAPSMQRLFTDNGLADFNQKLVSSGLIETVQSRRYVVSSGFLAAPSLTNSGELNGRFTWEYSMPVVLSFSGKDGEAKNRMIATVRLVRVPPTEHIDGIAVESISLKESGNV